MDGVEDLGPGVSLERVDGAWRLAGGSPGRTGPANDFMIYLQDRNYSPRTLRTYGYGLLAFVRWLQARDLTLEQVRTDDVLAFLSSCRTQTVRGRPGPNVVDLQGNRVDRLAPASVNLRLAAVAGLFEFLVMRDPDAVNPIPKGRPSTWFAPGERSGLLAHTKRRPVPRSRLRLRTPRRLPRALTRARSRGCSGACARLVTWRWPG